MDASEIDAKRLNAKEVLKPQNDEHSYGTVKLSGGDQALRTSTLILDNPDRGEEQEHLLGESDGSSSALLKDSSPDGTIFGPLQETTFPSPCGTASETVRAERSIIPNSTEIY